MALPKLKEIQWVTTDCYGTLIDWEKGISDAFAAEAKRDGFSFDEGPFIERFFEIQAEIIRGSYELYAEVLRRTAVQVASDLGCPVVLGEELLSLVLEQVHWVAAAYPTHTGRVRARPRIAATPRARRKPEMCRLA